LPTAALKRGLRRLRAHMDKDRVEPPRIPDDPATFGELLLGGELDEWQQAVLRSQEKKQIILASRQRGKSTVGALKALHRAVSVDRSLVLMIAPSERQSKELYQKVVAFYGDLVALGVRAHSYRKLGMELANGSRIEALPGAERTVRGFSAVSLLIVDEAARIEDDLYAALSPMLAVSGGALMMLSAPYGTRGIFHREWTEGEGWERHSITGYECPRIPPEFLEEERVSLPDRIFEQEYMCRFVELDDQVFSDAVIASMFSDESVTPLWEERR
jgi:hypothetical protein